jgi:hypothetical protein
LYTGEKRGGKTFWNWNDEFVLRIFTGKIQQMAVLNAAPNPYHHGRKHEAKKNQAALRLSITIFSTLHVLMTAAFSKQDIAIWDKRRVGLKK